MTENKVSGLFEKFSFNVLQKFSSTSESFNNEICRLENRYRTVSEMINLNNMRVESCNDFVKKADARFAKLEYESSRCATAVDFMEPLVTDFEVRV